jgi:hypothetical protein
MISSSIKEVDHKNLRQIIISSAIKEFDPRKLIAAVDKTDQSISQLSTSSSVSPEIQLEGFRRARDYYQCSSDTDYKRTIIAGDGRQL